MFSTDKQMGYQCFVSFFDLRDSSQLGETFRCRLESKLRWGNCPSSKSVFTNFVPCFLLSPEDNEPYMKVPCSESKITSAVWGPLGEFIIVGHENGELNQFSAKVGMDS